METKEKILYKYFLSGSKKIVRISKDKIHRQRLFDSIKTTYPNFMHPYLCGRMNDEEAEVSKNLIDVFKNNLISKFRRFMIKIKRFLGKQ